MTIARLWRDHSLTLVLSGVGVTLFLVALAFEPGSHGWDIFLGLSQGTLTVALFYALAGAFRERNKPED
jgi:hypothetical protein